MSVCHAGWAAYGCFVYELLHDGVVECIDSDQIADVSDELGHRLMVEVVLGPPSFQISTSVESVSALGAVGECSESMSGSSPPCRSGWC